MRLGEILSLKWEQVDLTQGYLTIIHTKNGKQRKIPINDAVRYVLERRPKNDINVFTRNGEAIISIRTAFERALKKAGIGHCRFHDLRHTFATRLILSGVSLPVVKELLGHSTILTTMRYSHPTPESKIDAVKRLESAEVVKDRHYMDTIQVSREGQIYVTHSD